MQAACLRSKPVSDIIQAFGSAPNPKRLPDLDLMYVGELAFKPYVDGAIIPFQPSDKGLRVPAVIGTSQSLATPPSVLLLTTVQ